MPEHIEYRHLGFCPCCAELICLRCIQLQAFMDNMTEAQEWSNLDRRAYRRAWKVYEAHRAERDHRYVNPKVRE